MSELVSHLDYAPRRSARLISVGAHSTPKPKLPRKRKRFEDNEPVSTGIQGQRDPQSSDLCTPEHDPSEQRRSRKRKTNEIEESSESVEPAYIIPDVERKASNFHGRLGYACLNTILRAKRPVASSIFCSRTCRLDSLKKSGVDFAKHLARKNVEDLLTIIQWNEDNNIRFFRLSSEMFPFASHRDYGYSLEFCAPLLAKAGALARKYSHRLTTHPGQYTQLGSPKPAVVEASVRDLEYHCQMLDLMNMGPDSVMVIHGGGVYGDKATTLRRLKESINTLPTNVRNRLVLENDELCYNAEDLLPVCEELDVPLVFDYHHDKLYPSSIPPSAIIQRANAIWTRRGIKPKQHLSEQRPGAVTLMERRAHSDRCENLPADLPPGMDLMIEAKDKEQAVLYLHRMYDLQPVIHASLRPATANPSMQTNGRKSSKRGSRSG
ncbi:hypothetical protein M413DRAFT_66385 [Hebeloma cylindrosporum]|uniref:UV-endonuclease UvdE n=1 Tax=Hebeloma cylindrosporum TaxID=76867 RepID=A0A0C3CNB0_HEBCY|nr:hypothetical protein M413DRAFT_66385 [Hebeloma cylindrosporum h7]